MLTNVMRFQRASWDSCTPEKEAEVTDRLSTAHGAGRLGYRAWGGGGPTEVFEAAAVMGADDQVLPSYILMDSSRWLWARCLSPTCVWALCTSPEPAVLDAILRSKGRERTLNWQNLNSEFTEKNHNGH